MRLGSIRPRDVSAYREQALGKRFSPATVGLHLTVLHDVFQGALTDELVQSNPLPASSVRGSRDSAGASSSRTRFRVFVRRPPTIGRGGCS